MTSIVNAIQRGLSAWRDDVDSAAADLPVIGGLFARSWRVLRYDASGCVYTNADGETLEISASEDADAARAEIARLGRKGPLVLRLAAPLGLKREASFPTAAKKHLEEAIELALPRLSPLPVEDILFAADTSGISETDGRFSLPISIMRQDTLAAAMRRASEFGLDIAAVDLETDDPRAAPAIDLRENRSSPSSGRSAFMMSAVITSILLVAIAGLTLDRNLRLDPVYEAARRPASLEARLEAAIEHAEDKSRAGSAVAALADLSRRLPDGAYVTGVSYENGTLRLTGLAWDAAAALRALDAADEFADAAFDGATVRDEETGRERFELTVRHRVTGSRS
ncbi:PilN domain-containing protein [Hyphobacterium sp.]|uniref:PilN domain-containing protein n=1 Tax=Hyphobacterium sp. TaxID=2004662 RepID=UPI003BAB5B2C